MQTGDRRRRHGHIRRTQTPRQTQTHIDRNKHTRHRQTQTDIDRNRHQTQTDTEMTGRNQRTDSEALRHRQAQSVSHKLTPLFIIPL